MESKYLSNKKAVSGVVTVVIMIALVMLTTLIIWGTIRTIVNDETEHSASCIESYKTTKLNSKYTCYDSANDELKFSIQVNDPAPEEILVSVTGETGAKTITLTSTGTDMDLNLIKEAGKNYGNAVKAPLKNSGTTYIVKGLSLISGRPEVIQIAPKINKKQCEISDSILGIEEC